MTRICVDTTLLVAASEAHRKNTESVRSNADEVGAVVRSLDWEIAAKQQYDKRIIRLQAELLRQARLLERHAAFLSFAESKYQMAELRVNGLSGLKVTVDGLLGALGDLITATFGGIVGVRILDFSRVLATQGLFVAVTLSLIHI